MHGGGGGFGGFGGFGGLGPGAPSLLRGRRVDGPRPGRLFGDAGRFAGRASTHLLVAVLAVLAVAFVLISLLF